MWCKYQHFELDLYYKYFGKSYMIHAFFKTCVRNNKQLVFLLLYHLYCGINIKLACQFTMCERCNISPKKYNGWKYKVR